MLQEILEITFLGNSLAGYLLSICILVLSCIVVRIFKRFILRNAKKWAEKTTTTIDDFLVQIFEKIVIPALYFAALYFSLRVLNLHPLVVKLMNAFAVAFLTIMTVRVLTESLVYGFNVYWLKTGRDDAIQRSLHGTMRVAKAIIWGLAIVFYLDN